MLSLFLLVKLSNLGVSRGEKGNWGLFGSMVWEPLVVFEKGLGGCRLFPGIVVFSRIWGKIFFVVSFFAFKIIQSWGIKR